MSCNTTEDLRLAEVKRILTSLSHAYKGNDSALAGRQGSAIVNDGRITVDHR